ncbi:hypothetical protein EMPG_10647 [Blastomyces silverae]|uniref:Uncharacterized protein n=1 Tax=Blastomyces silverae TaxID=2060906 RepID=A0A0H1B3D0_9EURO|nr:hypothetical protein EMPG_10647 [Blastomyces silverae]
MQICSSSRRSKFCGVPAHYSSHFHRGSTTVHTCTVHGAANEITERREKLREEESRPLKNPPPPLPMSSLKKGLKHPFIRKPHLSPPRTRVWAAVDHGRSITPSPTLQSLHRGSGQSNAMSRQ